MRREYESERWQEGLGDMSPEAFREHAHMVVDWIADYFKGIEEYPVLSTVRPGEIREALPPGPPETPEPFDAIFADFEREIMPGITHWNHPAFFAYFSITGSMPGILGEIVAAALNVNAMLWRTSPAATELEERSLDWLRQLLGLPDTFQGVIYDTASISTLVAVTAARQAAGVEVRRRGLAGRHELPALVMYCSEQSHSSVEKAGIILGIGQENVRKIATDAEFRMDASVLERAIEEDIAAGRKPFCVVATVGTTATTSIDPINAIADLCARFDLWLHVDGAYGGMAAIVPEMRWVLDGVERADSLVVNPHKWLFTPIDCSAFYSRRLDTVAEAFTLVPEYLKAHDANGVEDYMNYGPQLGRRFRALKLWFVLRSFGREGIINRLREHIRMAREFASWVDADPAWEVVAPVPFSTVVFRAAPPGMPAEEIDAVNRSIEAGVNATGKAFLAGTVLDGKVVLRLAVGNLRTEERHLRETWRLLRAALNGGVDAEAG